MQRCGENDSESTRERTQHDLPMHTTALEAKDVAEADRGPLRVLHATVTAVGIAGDGLDNGLVLWGHLHHFPGSGASGGAAGRR